MKIASTVSRALGVMILVATLVIWIALGAHFGWTRTYVEVKKVDEVTEIEYSERVDRFIPGVEFLALGGGAGLTLIVLSFLLNLKSSKKS